MLSIFDLTRSHDLFVPRTFSKTLLVRAEVDRDVEAHFIEQELHEPIDGAQHAIGGEMGICEAVFRREMDKLGETVVHERLAIQRPMHEVRSDASLSDLSQKERATLLVQVGFGDDLMMFRVGLRTKGALEVTDVGNLESDILRHVC
jgi:hypothetical protein